MCMWGENILFEIHIHLMYLIHRILTSDEYSNLQYVIMRVRRSLIVASILASRNLAKKIIDPIPFPVIIKGLMAKANGFVIQFLIILTK